MSEQPETSQQTEGQPVEGSLRGRYIAIGIYLALSVGLYFVLAPALADQSRLQSQIEKAGWGGVLLYISLYAAQVFIPWLPGVPLDMIGGAVFGFWETTVLSSASAALSGLIVYLVVQRVGLERIVERFPNLLDAPWRLIRVIRLQPWALVAANMLTGDVAYFVAGAAETPVLFTLVVLGALRIPNVMLGAAIGAGLISQRLQQHLDIAITVAGIGTIIMLSIGFLVVRRYAPRWLERLEMAAQKSEENEKNGAL